MDQRKDIAGAIVAAALIAGYATQAVSAQSHSKKVRNIRSQISTPIQDLLRPDDEVVEVIRGDILISEGIGVPAPEVLISYLVSESDVVAVVNVNAVAGILVESGTWIHTRVTATVSEVLKDQNRPLRVGSSLRFELVEGEVSIGKVLVRTEGYEPTIVADRSYLVFAQVNPGDGRLYPRHVPLLIEGDSLVRKRLPSTTSKDERDPLDGYSLKKVIEQVRRLVKTAK